MLRLSSFTSMPLTVLSTDPRRSLSITIDSNESAIKLPSIPDDSETLTERMTIFSDGKLGVNTNAPQNHHVFASGSTEIFGGDLIINRDDGSDVDPILQFQLDSGLTATGAVGDDTS